MDKYKKDRNNYFLFYEKHNLLDNISKLMNDIYLFLNKEKDSTSSYNDVSQLESTGKIDDDGYEIFVYTNYSKYQLLMIQNYINHMDIW